MFHGKLKWIAALFLFAAAAVAGYALYLYQQGGAEQYRPPEARTESPQTEAVNGLRALSQAVETYNAKNLSYPDNLEQLQPEFIDRIPLEPGTEKPFVYESDGRDRYRIAASEPSRYAFKELYVENGELVQK